MIELDNVSRITAASLGEPGQRVFYLQARSDEVLVSLLLEKQQVALLALNIDDLLDRVGRVPEDDDPGVPDPDALDLEQPVVAEFRVGAIGLGYDEGRDMVLVQCEEYVPPLEGEEEIEPIEGPEGESVKLWVTRGQAFAMARRGEREVSSGRPVCRMCGESIDPDVTHFCPRSNGHRAISELS